MRRTAMLTMCVALTLSVASCHRPENSPTAEPRYRDPSPVSLPEKSKPREPANDAEARLAPMSGSEVSGSLALAQSPQGVRIMGAVQGLPPEGEFDFQVLEHTDCANLDGSTADSRAESTSGDSAPETRAQAPPVVADVTAIRSNQAGVAQVDTTAPGVTVGSHGATAILGKTIVVREQRSSENTASATSGRPLACGLIVASTLGQP